MNSFAFENIDSSNFFDNEEMTSSLESLIEDPKGPDFSSLDIVDRVGSSKHPVFDVYCPNTNNHYALKCFPIKNGKLSSCYLNSIRFAGLFHPNIVSSIAHQDEQ
mmetsp:Transcript_28135/g.24878  ORF Transcript_28135/g.24878 Transcript_28135/m.24878 type:complete len:105 (-) Transcript_28135:1047-1361(-)